MIKADTKKICIVVSSLGVGGAERSSAILSEILFDLNFDVHIVSVQDKVDYPYKGKLFNLGELKTEHNSKISRLKRLKIFKRYLKAQNFDYVIDNRTRIGLLKELIISKWVYKPNKTIYCVRSYYTDNYINPNRFLSRLLYNSAYKIVSVSHAISKKLRHNFKFKNLEVIHNPVAIDNKESKIENSSHDHYILFFGRLNDEIKNISLLLEAYSKSKLPKCAIKLKILGSGDDKQLLKDKSKTLGVENEVEFLDFKANPYTYVEAAFFTVLTSRYEGFPRAIVESLALGVPVVSVDCKSGPNEIIINEQNGLLVENHNVDTLSIAMNRMLEDEDLYLHCKSNAKDSIAKFSKTTIGLQWKAILK
ncbi:glycosyltransferase [uncultured Winogradskyella sp.]|uniref:glycosyltransferase n=1 Tax=uncultured Winogradskyella sp. TaxID=395353 RepID=UPI00262B1186|nr:glycosyltransferase [uncultured Winogradskyella sp.]